MKVLFALIAVAIVLIGFPLWTLACIRELYGGKSRKASTIALGNALQELDRLVARPALVHKIEVENNLVDTNDDHGGE